MSPAVDPLAHVHVRESGLFEQEAAAAPAENC